MASPFARVHDWMRARAARKAEVAELLTDNLSDFVVSFHRVPPGFEIDDLHGRAYPPTAAYFFIPRRQAKRARRYAAVTQAA